MDSEQYFWETCKKICYCAITEQQFVGCCQLFIATIDTLCHIVSTVLKQALGEETLKNNGNTSSIHLPDFDKSSRAVDDTAAIRLDTTCRKFLPLPPCSSLFCGISRVIIM
ncbi:hypothetical protein Tsp_07551 [Trichinella spiralis]|uniref:hypothetical protein n=1 Tax=Trichinella spiralis TaxID=6334 RepID=UPI0001EFB5B1|nr:hypothetical protein Tsp_07551 [Trichinella spiralis]